MALGAGGIAAIIAILLGIDVAFTPTLALTVTGRPHWVAYVGLLVVVAIIVGTATFLARALTRGRIGIEKVTAGPATITLPPRSASYFDEYLDEIIYFFENNSKRDIVIIEDLDRFDDPQIFESLRSLNGLLNSAQQLNKRNIRFIYAMRDSVFEKLGQKVSEGMADEARAELSRANRTKFFELVIPVVPFITHKNAADLMARELESRDLKVSKDLINLAARHLADMRLIHNIINEYVVFKHRLLDVEGPVPGLDEDRLFAMVLFKNAHMGQFERIRHATSSLDELWTLWRELVETNTHSIRLRNRELRTKISNRSSGARYATEVAQLLTSRIDALFTAPGTGLASATLSYNGANVDLPTLSKPSFWLDIAEAGGSITLQANPPPYNSGPQTMSLSLDTLERLVGRALGAQDFKNDENADDAEKTLASNEEALVRLQRATWKELAEYPEFTYQSDDSEASSFRQWAVQKLPSRLAADLVINGYITSYFPLHVSSFYGTLIRPSAMTYVMRFVDHGKNDPDFVLDADDAAAILRDQGLSVLQETSMFNVGIVDYLLATQLHHGAIVVRNIATNGPAGSDFIDRYLEAGAEKASFVTLLTPHMREVFVRLATTSSLLPKERAELVGAAIGARVAEVRYKFSDDLRVLLQTEFASMPALMQGATELEATRAVQFVADAGAVVPSLRGLPEVALDAFRSTRAYKLSLENLEILSGETDISLDNLAASSAALVSYAIGAPTAYAAAFGSSEETPLAVATNEQLTAFLESAARSDLDAAEAIASHTGPEVMLSDLSLLAPAVWPVLMRNRLMRLTFQNVAAYVKEVGLVDDHLAVSLNAVDEVSEADDAEPLDRARLALAILNSPAEVLGVKQRVKLAVSLDPGVLAAADITPRAGNMVGDLLVSLATLARTTRAI
ncbi:hypothetical protein B7R21_17920 [Subtercola boreus]|uniref:YobI-like P-loop NTPase domain-containing protein n=1 Tax=Subtercola boreus TaxID=120213 RepID=A0A3E0VBX4_9MICO|nr:hypothetical protein B7R21_17920 [Subtercola boreus]